MWSYSSLTVPQNVNKRASPAGVVPLPLAASASGENHRQAYMSAYTATYLLNVELQHPVTHFRASGSNQASFG